MERISTRTFAYHLTMKIPSYMKKLILLAGVLVSITAANIVFGQATGVITYEVKVNMHRNIPAEREGMKAMIPEFRTTKQQLFFNASESIYKPVIEDEEEQFSTAGSGGGGMRMTFRMPNVEIYMDQNSGKVISKQDFMGKNYLIEDSVTMSPWKFGTETRMIGEYPCNMAYYSRTDTLRISRGSEPAEPVIRTSEITLGTQLKFGLSLGLTDTIHYRVQCWLLILTMENACCWQKLLS